jgi:hypothetical protein
VEILGGALSKVYIPRDGYTCGVTVSESHNNGNGILFTPTAQDEHRTFKSGFGVLADAKNGVTFRLRSAAGQNGQTVNTCLLPESAGELWARKVVEGEYATDSDYARDWTLAATVNGETFAATAKHGETHFIGNFIKGWSYDLTESAEDMHYYDSTYKVEYGPSLDYLTEDSSGEGKSASGTIQCCNLVTFNNVRKFEPLTVKKAVYSRYDEDYDKEWLFTLKVTDGLKDMPYTQLTAPDAAQGWDDSDKANGIYRFTLKHDKSLDITLPLGCRYEITEAEDRDFVAAIAHGEGTFSQATTVTVTNRERTEHNLTLDKRVEGNMGNYGKYFMYTVNINIPIGNGKEYAIEGDFDPAPMVNARERISDATQAGSSGAEVPTSIYLNEGANTFTVWLAHGDSFTIRELPSGTGYSFTETNDLDYQVSTAIVGDIRYGDTASTHPIALVRRSRDTAVTVSDTSLNRTTDVSFTNYRNESIPTGIYDNIRAALWGLAIVLALGLVQTHCAARRNKRRIMRVRRS